MKFRFVVEAEIDFDQESNGEVSTERESLDSDIVGQTINAEITRMLDDDAEAGEIVDAITNATGWCIKGMSIKVTDAECTDYLD